MIIYPANVPESPRPTDWRDNALCSSKKGEDPEDWFPNGASVDAKAAENHAKAVCWVCPSADLCLQWALETGQEYGVWGGLSESERRRIRRRKRAVS